MTEIFLIRHGETDWNVEKRLQGHTDIPLNNEGERQAEALAKALSEEALDAIYASDLLRARQTAEAIAAAQGMQVHIDAGLKERCYGALEGLRHGDIKERYPDAYAVWRSRDIHACLPAGPRDAETLFEFSQRAVSAITRLAQHHPEQKIAIVSHGGVLDCIYRAAAGKNLDAPRDFDILNAAINRLRWNGSSLQVLEWGSISHLLQPVLDEVDK